MATETAEQVIQAATRLFAERGYDGVSVRDICTAAEVSANAVHYHFKSKQGLYEQIIERFGLAKQEAAERILVGTPKDTDEFATRLEIFAREILESLLSEPDVLTITQMEMLQGFRHGGESFAKSKEQCLGALRAYVETAQGAGIVREGVDPAYVVGTLMDRVFNQAIYASSLRQMYDASIDDPDYRAEWVRKTVDLLVNGLKSN
jgi:AcrR family transcriptional regulator